MKRLLKTLLLPIVALAMAFAFIACDGEQTFDGTYSVTYVIGEDAQGTAPTETDKAVGEKFKLKSADDIKCEGMKFMGWEDGSDTVYKPGDEYTMPAKAVTFTAKWEKDGHEQPENPTKYKVTYDLNGGSGTLPTETDKAKGEKFKLATATGLKNGDKELKGWSDGTKTYDPGVEYTMPEKAVTFTAQWSDGEQEQPVAKYTVTYKHGAAVTENGTAVADVKVQNQAAGNYTVAHPSAYYYFVEPKTYLFAGWVNQKNKNDDNSAVYLPDQTMTLGENTTLEALWVTANETLGWADLSNNLSLYAYPNGTGACWYVDANDKEVWTFFTYTENEGTIKATPVGGTEITGTLNEKGELTMTVQINGHTYNFAPKQEQPQGKPTFTFDSNGGTGNAPVIADSDVVYNENSGLYKVKLPQNTYTAPEGKEFDKWAIGADNNTRKAGETYFANAGEKLNIKAIWKDAAAEAPTGTEYFGDCHIVVNNPITPVNVTVEAIMFDVEKGKMYYRIDDSLTYKKSTSVQNQDSDNNKPTDYGANAKFYEVKIENAALYLLLDVDNKLKLYNTSYEPYANGEFRIINLNPTEYTVTFDPNNGEDTWDVPVSSIGIVQKPQTIPVHSSGKVFRYWKDDATGEEYTFGSAPTCNLTLVAIYAWEITYSAGEGSGTIDPMYVNMWSAAGVVLPDASDLSNGSKVFAGWWDGTYDVEDPTVKNIYAAGERYVGSGNVNFVAQWRVDNSYVVGFVKAVRYGDRSKVTGDNPELPAKIEAGTTFEAPANTYTLAGYEFDGWELHEFSASTELGAKLGDYAVGDDIIMPAKPVQLVAKWKAIKTSATVTYKAGAHGTGADVVKNNVTFNTQYKLINNPFTVENYYMFIGWKVEGDDSDNAPLTEKYNLTDDVVFVAQYVNAYSNYDNDGTSAMNLYFDTSAGVLYIFNEDDTMTEVMLTVSTSGNNITLTPEGGAACTGTFVNNTLNIALAVSGKTYTFGNPSAATTKYTVTYVLGDGATGAVPTETDKAVGDKFNLAASTGLSNGDKEFDGWSDGTTKYAAGAEYTMPDHAVTFTAQWKDDEQQGGGELTFVNVQLADLNGKVFDAGKTILSTTSFGTTTNYTAALLAYDDNFNSYKLVLIVDTSKTTGRTYAQDSSDKATSGTEFVWKDGTITFGFVQDGGKYKLIITSIKISNTEKLESPVELSEVEN